MLHSIKTAQYVTTFQKLEKNWARQGMMNFDISNNDKHMKMNDTDCNGLKHINSKALIHEIRFETVENLRETWKKALLLCSLSFLIRSRTKGNSQYSTSSIMYCGKDATIKCYYYNVCLWRSCLTPFPKACPDFNFYLILNCLGFHVTTEG